MKSIVIYQDQLDLLKETAWANKSDKVNVDLTQSGIKSDYFSKVSNAADSLVLFGNRHIFANEEIRQSILSRIGSDNQEDLWLCMLVDIMRSYLGLNHPTTFTSPEGVALMILIGKIYGIAEINSFESLSCVNSSVLTLIDIIPYVGEVSNELGNNESLFVSSVLEQIDSTIDINYRRLIYRFCKAVAEVDGIIDLSEKEWLEAIARLDDDDENNDIDISDL